MNNILTQPVAEAAERLLRFVRCIYWRDAHIGTPKKAADVVLAPDKWHALMEDLGTVSTAVGFADVCAPSTSLVCSFCGKPSDEVGRMMLSDYGRLCVRCIVTEYKALQSHRNLDDLMAMAFPSLPTETGEAHP